MKRLCVWLAGWLIKGTDCCIVRSNNLQSLLRRADDLVDYVEDSGGLQDPRRIRAYRNILRSAVDLGHDLRDLAA